MAAISTECPWCHVRLAQSKLKQHMRRRCPLRPDAPPKKYVPQPYQIVHEEAVVQSPEHPSIMSDREFWDYIYEKVPPVWQGGRADGNS
jgi:hypothetical protein